MTHHPYGPASHWCAERAGWVSSWWFSSGRWGPALHCSPAGAVPAPPASGCPELPRSRASQPCGDHLQSRLCGPGDRQRLRRSAGPRGWDHADADGAMVGWRGEDTEGEVQTATVTPGRGHSARPGASHSGRGHSTPSGTGFLSPYAHDVPGRKRVSPKADSRTCSRGLSPAPRGGDTVGRAEGPTRTQPNGVHSAGGGRRRAQAAPDRIEGLSPR